MDEKEGLWILVVFIFLIAVPLSNGLIGNSSSYDVVISAISMAGFEDTNQPNESIEFNMDTIPFGDGNSSNYTILLGLSKLLGPIAFNISITPHMAKNDSVINCTGLNAFAHNDFEMPKHYYRFTDGINNITTDWNESGILNCSDFSTCNEPNITCHFKVDDSHMNSTEIIKTIIVDTTNPVIRLISPLNDTEFFNPAIWTFEYNVSDKNIVSSCDFIINKEIINTTILPEKNTSINFTYFLERNIYGWNVNCTDEAGNIGQSERWVLKTYFENMWIENAGVTGFENVSNEYTISRDIIINVNFSGNAENCRLKNEEDEWSSWSICQPLMPWRLSEENGNKTVYLEINHKGDVITDFSDRIIFESNGSNLDITPPLNFTVYDEGEFTNDNESLSFTWDTPSDFETELLGLDITFTYILKDSNGTYITNWSAPQESVLAEITGLSLVENHTYILVVNATNPASLIAKSESDGIKIDLTPPLMTGISGPDRSIWLNNNTLSFNFSASDNISGVAGYSMILDNNNETIADLIPETDYSNNRSYSNKDDGIYYFHIGPYDNANNFGETLNYGPVNIDMTPPSEPTPINPIEFAVSDEIMFFWHTSTDLLSGVKEYNITIINNKTGLNNSYSTTGTNYSLSAINGTQYFLLVTAIDNAGNQRSTELAKTTSLQILSARPNNYATVNDNPIIKVETNKIAICKEDYTNEAFLFTSSTYHETRIEQGDGTYTLVITCKDDDGFYAVKNITYKVEYAQSPGILAIDAINDVYTGKTVYATINGVGLGQLSREKFRVYINDSEISDFTINDIDDAGNYSLQFQVSGAGLYALKVEIEGTAPATQNFTVIGLNLNVEYTGNLNAATESHLIYADSEDNKVGLASDSKQVETAIGSDKIILNSSLDGKIYLFFTKNNLNIKTKDTQLKNNEFSKNTNAFGYPGDNDYRITTSLEYKTLIIQGLKELSGGIYSLDLYC